MNELQMKLIQRKTAEARDEGIIEGRNEGRIEGVLQNQNDIVTRMIEKNYTIEEIAEITGITLERVKEIANCIKPVD